MPLYNTNTDFAVEQINLYKERGAIIIDVRTNWEFEIEHAPHSILIPINVIVENIERIKAMEKPVILVCHTGQRASVVESYLRKQGIDAINAGPWQAVL